MNEYLLLKYAHIIAFVYWLGGDLGTYIASKWAINREISAEARKVALKIMLACDQGPKLSMPLILPFGVQMAATIGVLEMPSWLLTTMWVICTYWVSVVLVLYLNEGKDFVKKLSQIDFYFRIVVIVALLGLTLMAMTTGNGFNADWVGYKLIIFALMVLCGVFIRINLKPFIPAFGNMLRGDTSEANNDVIYRSMMRCRPYIYGIWAGLFINAALGLHLF